MEFGSNRILVSMRIMEDLWQEFDSIIEKEYGRYKKSRVIEYLIREYVRNKKSN